MKALANFILRGPSQAILVAVGIAVLSMMLPPLSLLSGAVIALVTLRKGPQSGAMVMIGCTAFIGALAYFSFGNATAGLVFLGLLWLPLWILGWVLRETRALALATAVAGVLGMLAVVLMYAFVGDISNWWYQVLLEMFKPAMEQGGVLADPAEVEVILAELSKVMTGVAAAGLVLNTILCLYLARFWQALLFNPGGFREEFHGLRLGKGLAMLSLAFIAMSLLSLGAVSHMAGEIVIVILSLYILQGLALLHAVVAQREMHVAWLVVTYLLMLFVLPQLTVLVALIGLVDTWADFRRRLAKN